MFNTTDDETVEQLAFNLQWHFALDLPGESDTVKYISRKTLWTMRRMLNERELDTFLFSKVTDKLAKVFSVDTRNQRLDSVHITSNMRRLGRIGIFVRVITRFLLNRVVIIGICSNRWASPMSVDISPVRGKGPFRWSGPPNRTERWSR